MNLPVIRPLLIVEANEVNFEFIKRYIDRGQLPCIASLLKRHNLITTESEALSEHVEPWIQWVTVHTGKSFSEHGVFRLGDVVGRGLDQIWEILESRGFTVGAMCPMNAENRLRAPAFFVPDPWTHTKTSGDPIILKMHSALVQAVASNAEGRITAASLLALLQAFMRYIPVQRWRRYADLVIKSRRRPWLRAIALDEFLSDVFIHLLATKKPHFATLFLNAAAHIQHHYLFSAAVYEGSECNPEWYVPRTVDPILDAYSAYDDLIRRLILHNPEARIIVATGLHQDPDSRGVYYWRLKNHAQFLSAAGIKVSAVTGLMSRDFVIHCSDASQTRDAQLALEAARIATNQSRVFECDNRGRSLFCTLVYEHPIAAGTSIHINHRTIDFSDAVCFVAIKNGKHNGIGYMIDTGAETATTHIKLERIFSIVEEHFDASLITT